ncbi:MAG: TraR/DksA family transcriptional regulator [Akkermansiaceae bacterium]|nr:TraR/DksA family transcriptional regulator [Akkermansiaceae bacterium]
MMPGIRKTEKEKLKKALLEQRVELVEELRRHGEVEEPGGTSDLKDSEERASSVTDLWVESRIVADDRNLLEKIDLALEKIEDGSYGICTNCKEVIPVARLLAKPSASLCVSCQELKDTGKL